MSPGPLRRGRDFRHFAVFLTSGVVSSTLKLRLNGSKLSSTSAVTPESGQKSVKKSPLYCFGSQIACDFGAFQTENFRKSFGGRKMFGPRSLEIAPEIRPARRCPALPRVKQVPKAPAECRRAAACGIACNFGAVRTENFRKTSPAQSLTNRPWRPILTKIKHFMLCTGKSKGCKRAASHGL